MVPSDFVNAVIGKSIDIDNFPAGNKYQCWDLFAYFNKMLNIPVQCNCSLTGYVCDLWRLKDKYGYSRYYEYITDPSKLKNGDWLIWDKGSSNPFSHVAMYWNGQILGQNQGQRYVNIVASKFDIMGALRYRYWSDNKKGVAECMNKAKAGRYKATDYVNIRSGGELTYSVVATVPPGSLVNCYGYYHIDKNGAVWLYVTWNGITGFMHSSYLQRY